MKRKLRVLLLIMNLNHNQNQINNNYKRIDHLKLLVALTRVKDNSNCMVGSMIRWILLIWMKMKIVRIKLKTMRMIMTTIWSLYNHLNRVLYKLNNYLREIMVVVVLVQVMSLQSLHPLIAISSKLLKGLMAMNKRVQIYPRKHLRNTLKIKRRMLLVVVIQ